MFPEGYRLIDGNYYRIGDRSGPYVIDENGNATLVGAININAENIDLDLDPQALADAGNLAPDGSPAEGSANALLAAIKTAIEELEISGGGASAGDIATAINNALRASDLGVAVADLDTLATAALQDDIKGLLTAMDADTSALVALIDSGRLKVSVDGIEFDGELGIDNEALAAAIDSAMRDSPLPVSGPLTDTELRATAVPVTGPLTDTQLRDSPVPVSVSDVATATNQTAGNTLLGAVNESAPGSDTASSGLNGRLQRIAQHITSLIAVLPASLGGKTAANSLSVTTSTDDPSLARMGTLTESAPGSDTASSGLNGRLQRISQRLTSLIGLLPASLGGKAAAESLSVTTATDDPVLSRVGATNESAASTDTSTSGLNGLLKRIAQNVTSAIAAINDGSIPTSALRRDRLVNTNGNATAFTGGFAATASTVKHVTAISIANSSGTPCSVDFRDGTSGSVLFTVPVGPNGVVMSGSVPFFTTSANTALAIDASAAIDALTISVSGFAEAA